MAEEPHAGFAPEPTPEQPAVRKRAAADWRGPSNAPSKGKIVAITLVLLLGVSGVIAGLIFWPKPPVESRLVSMPIDQYGEYWPVNPWAENDANRLVEIVGERGSKAFNYQQADKFRLWLDWLAAKPGSTPSDLPGDFASRPLILHITGFAAARADGVYLLLPGPSNTSFEQSVEWLKIDELFDAVAACPAKQKLLLLDLARPIADSFNGLLQDDVAAFLDQTLSARKKANRLPCPVLTSCGPGQFSQSCDSERCSAFAFYIGEGLRGAADGARQADSRDEVINADELVRYVAARTERWSRICFGERQQPTLYANDDASLDFIVTYHRNLPADRYDPATPPSYPPGVQQGWQNYSKLRETIGMPRRAQWAAGLLRAEQLTTRSGRQDRADEAWRRAEPIDRGFNDGLTATKSATDGVKAVAARFRLPLKPAAPPEALAELGKLLDAWQSAKPEDEAKAKSAWQAKAGELPLDAARIVWQRATAAERLERKELRRWADAVAGLKLPQAETVLLERLARFDFVQEQGLAKSPEDALAALLHAEAMVGRIAATPPRGFAAFGEVFIAADTIRREAERALFAAKSLAEADEAGTRLKQATAELNRLLKRLELRRAAAEVADSALVVLLDTMPAAIEFNRPDFGEWKTAAELLKSLLDRLAATERNAASDGSEWSRETVLLPGLLKGLRSRFEPEPILKALKDSPRGSAEETARLAELLAGPALVGDARTAVWNAWQSDLTALHGKVRQQDKADDESGFLVAEPRRDGKSFAVDVTMRRAEASVMLLAVAGSANLAESDGLLRAVKADPSNAAAWGKLGTVLRNEWLVGLPAQSRDAATANQWTVAGRILRTTPVELARYPRDLPPDRGDREKMDAIAQRLWILKQLADDEPLRSRSDWAKRFYDEVRRELNQP